MLPSWVIESKTTWHTSSRPPQRKHPDWAKIERDKRWERDRNRWRRPVVEESKKQLDVLCAGTLHLNEYRFWRAASGGAGMCRACHEHIGTPSERMNHQKKKGCTRDLVEAYKYLLKDRKCVVCDTETKFTKWGIPLCCSGCVYRWQFEIGAGSYPVHYALKLYRNVGSVKK